MTASYAIMAHPEREGETFKLMQKIGRDVATAWDWKCDRWDTGKRALELGSRKAKWHVVLQDDALPTAQFRVEAERVLDAVPDDGPVSFYMGTGKPYPEEIRRLVSTALVQGASFISSAGPLWGVAVAFPTKLIDEAIQRADKVSAPQYDMRLAMAFGEMGKRCLYTVPSLVDHLDHRSLVRGPVEPTIRRAHALGGQVDIDGPVLRDEEVFRKHAQIQRMLQVSRSHGIKVQWEHPGASNPRD